MLAIAEGYYRDPESVPDGELRCGNSEEPGRSLQVVRADAYSDYPYDCNKLTVRRRRGNTGSPAGSATCRQTCRHR